VLRPATAHQSRSDPGEYALPVLDHL